MGQVLYEVGGADIVDGEGSVVGSISATPMDENGNPIPEPETETAADEPEAETAADEPETETAADDGESSDEASEWTEAELSGPAALLAARNVATGTISDRQPLAAPDMTEQTLMAGDEFGKDMAAATEDGYPGREYTLRFKAGEDAKFLGITPLYSEAAEPPAAAPPPRTAPQESRHRAMASAHGDSDGGCRLHARPDSRTPADSHRP
jgi:hypothetical protein